MTSISQVLSGRVGVLIGVQIPVSGPFSCLYLVGVIISGKEGVFSGTMDVSSGVAVWLGSLWCLRLLFSLRFCLLLLLSLTARSSGLNVGRGKFVSGMCGRGPGGLGRVAIVSGDSCE